MNGKSNRLSPLGDLVLLEEETPLAYHVYKGLTHIIVPDRYQHGPEDRAVTGIVKEKGKQCSNTDIHLGDRVVIGKWDGARFPQDGKTMILVREDSILAVIE